MNNQTSIKYISALLENPQTITDGDQSSIALFRQTFPYFIPARYLVALESHKKTPYTPQMLTAIQPYLGDWIRFCDFLEAGNGAVGEMAVVNKVTGRQSVDTQSGPVVSAPVVSVVPEVQKQPEAVAPSIVLEEAKPVQPEIIPDTVLSVPQSVVKEQEPAAIQPDITVPVTPVVNEAVRQHEVSIAMPPLAEAVVEVIKGPKWPVDEEVAPVVIPSAPDVVVAKEEPPIFDMPVAFVVEAPPAEWPADPVAPGDDVLPAPQEIPAPVMVSAPIEAAFGSIPLAPVPVVIADDDEVLPEYHFGSSEGAAPEEIIPEPHIGLVVELPEPEDAIFPEDPAILPDTAPDTVEESDFAKAWAEMEAQVEVPVADISGAVQVMDEDESAVSVTETNVETDHDPLIFPIYTKDYFLQQGEKVSEEIPLEISELKDAGGMSEEDKSLMVVMSFSEWLLHFKSTSEKQKEETKDQKALKTMWQKEKLAAAMEEENEEIPETVFEMAVNSISKEDGLVSESLADIYIKQGKYDKAIEMYRKLSLRNPQKSAYFARKIEEALKDKQS